MFDFLPWWVKLEWRTPKKVMLGLNAFEFAPTIAALTLSGIADPNTYRTQLWQEGANQGWNSDPSELLYAAANYKPIQAPLPWRQITTDWALVISVLSTFILLIKIFMYLTHTLPPLFNAIIHGALVVVWAYSISLQTASDYVDPEHPARTPWMFTHGCGDPVSPDLQGYCRQAVGFLGVSCIELALFVAYFVLSMLQVFPSEEAKAKRREEEREAQEWRDIENYETKDHDFEQELDQMHVPPQSPHFPAYPMTPSKTAFGVYTSDVQMQMQPPGPMPSEQRMSVSSAGSGSTGQMTRMNRDLPLRHHITSDVYA